MMAFDDHPRATAFHDRTYREALDLTVEARNWLAWGAGRGPADASTPARLAYARETMRLTTRLTQVMAWVLAQRAVFAGEMSASETLKPEWRLGGGEICLEEVPPDEQERLPGPLLDLLDRSRRLYVRVLRLEELAARSA